MSEIDLNDDLFNTSTSPSDWELGSSPEQDRLFKKLFATDFEILQNLVSETLSQALPSLQTKIDFPLNKERLKRLLAAHQGKIDPVVEQHCQALWQLANQKWAQINETAGLTLAEIELRKQIVLQQTQEEIGKTLLLSLKNPQWLIETLQSAIPASVLSASIDQQFTQVIKTFISRLQNFYRCQQLMGIQDPELSYSMRLPAELAPLLLTEIGYLNLGVLPLMKEVLFPQGKELLEFQTHILRLLNQINPKWQPTLDAIQKPTEPSAAADAIRADLGLSRTTALTDLHAKQCALGALFTQHRQGPVGNSFSLAYAVRIHDNFPQTALSHYGQLLQTGSLQRQVQGQPARFFFKATIADQDLDRPIVINKEGKVGGENYFLWDVPSFVSAFTQMGIEDPIDLLPQTVYAMADVDSSHLISTTPRAILQAFASVASQTQAEDLFQKGLYGFSTLNNRTLRAYETALASMAQSRSFDPIRDRAIMSIVGGMVPVWIQNQGMLDPDTMFQIRETFTQALNQQMRYVYNAVTPYENLSQDGSSSSSAFELYQVETQDDSAIGTPIKTPFDLQQMILNVWMGHTFMNLPFPLNVRPEVRDFFFRVPSLIMQSNFPKDIFILYESKIGMEMDPVASYQKYDTPMVTRTGADPYDVIEVQEGISSLPQLQSTVINDSENLLKWALSLAVTKQKTLRYLEDPIPDEMDPVTTPQHAFNLALENPDIIAFIKSGVNPSDWIQRKMALPGQNIANGLISLESKQLFVQEILTNLPDEVKSPFEQFATALDTQSLSLSQYAQTLLSGLKGLFPPSSQVEQQLTLIVDRALLKAIPFLQSKALQEQAMRFANTHWQEGIKEIYFCIYFNPRTQKLSLATIHEDKTELNPASELDWIQGVRWDTDISNTTL